MKNARGFVASLIISSIPIIAHSQESKVNHLPSQEKVYSACYNQGAFLMYAASAGSLYIDPSIPPEEVLAKTGRYTTDTSAYDRMVENASKFGVALLLSKKEVTGYVRYFYENQDDARFYSSPVTPDAMLRDCTVNPKKFIPSYSRLESAGKLK